MPTLFTLILFWWLLAMGVTVVLPYLLYRHTDAQPENRTLVIWSVICLASTLHGGMAYYAGYHKGGKVRDFLIGAILMPFSFPVVAWLNRNEETRLPGPPKGLIKTLDRGAFALGNIWFGIGQLVVMIGFLLRATIYENQFSDKGNEAAYAGYYNHPLMGLLFALFFVTIFCATMRKYPFRWHQVGWLTVHSGLLIMMIGCMMMYWGSFSGFTILYEGESTSLVRDNEIREIAVQIPALQYNEIHRVSVDYDTEKKEVEQIIPISAEHNGRTEDYEIEIDRYISRGEFYTDIAPSNDPRDGVGMKIRMTAPGFDREEILLERGSRSRFQIGSLDIMIQGLRSEAFVDSIGHRYRESERGRGRLEVFRGAEKVGEVPILVGDPVGGPQQGRVVGSTPIMIDDVRLKVERYFDLLTLDGDGAPLDSAPGEARSPGLALRLSGQSGDALVNVSSLFSTQPVPSDNVYGLRFEYEVLHEIEIGTGMALVTQTPRDGWVIALGTRDGVRREKLELDRPYAFADDAPIRFTVEKTLDRARVEEGIRPTTKRQNFRALRCKVKHGDLSETIWLVHGMRQPTQVRVGAKQILLDYRSRRVDLPFQLSLLDFRQFEYANSGKPERFETNLVLRDPAKEIEEAVLVDMNHPLGWAGYRFFNGSPLLEEQNARRGVLLQVGSNPGYPVIIVSSILILAGIITVFGFKKSIRDWDMRRKRAAEAA